MAARIDKSGMVFEWLLALERVANDRFGGRYLCQCLRPGCGNEVIVSDSNLRKTKSCNCLNRELSAERGRAQFLTHGLSHTRTYQAWHNMMDRCYDENHPHYANYGGAGRTACERWRAQENFYADMGECPPGMQLDREKNELGYWCGKCPQCLANGWVFNCRWVTRLENNRNKSNNTKILFQGELLAVSEISERTGIKPGTIYYRLHHGWSDHDAVTVKTGGKRPGERKSEASE